MFKSVGLSLLFVSIPAFAGHFDPPDLTLEYQLHKQYLRSLGSGEKIEAPTGRLENYQLQQGESLWGLSQMLYGDGNYWPKVWAQNPGVTNPHLIRKGHTLQFLMGSEDEAPAFRFSEDGEGGVELTAATLSSNPQIEVPPPEIPPRPVIKVPPSFPDWQRVFRSQPELGIDDSKISVTRNMPPNRVLVTAYVQDSKLEPLGHFVSNEQEGGLPMDNQYVLVKMKKGSGGSGQKLLIVNDVAMIKRLNKQVERGIVAHFIQIHGELELADMIPSREADKDKDYDIYRALILRATHLPRSGFALIPGKVESVSMTVDGPSGQVEAQIIGSAKHETSALYGAGDIVFLNRGSKNGVEVGQILDLYVDRRIRDMKTEVSFSTVPSGKVKIVKTSGLVSTGVIVTAVDGIQQGDVLRPHLAMSGDSFHSPSTTMPPSDDSDFALPPEGSEQTTPTPNPDDLPVE